MPNKFKYYTRTARGTEEVLPPMKKLFRRVCDGRAIPIIKKPKIVKTKRQLWLAKHLQAFFVDTEIIPIHADRTDWIIFFDEPNRKMTVADQLELFLQHPQTQHYLKINYDRKHLIIDSLKGED